MKNTKKVDVCVMIQMDIPIDEPLDDDVSLVKRILVKLDNLVEANDIEGNPCLFIENVNDSDIIPYDEDFEEDD